MSGIDILAIEEVAVEFVWNWTAFWIIAGLITLVGLVFAICKVVDGGYSWPLIPALLILFAFIGVGFGLVSANALKKPTKYEYHYKVTVSPEVSMTTFMDKYEIVDTEGRIYIVREKEMDED